jgi:predicted MFS family arabinose efflux permease
LEARWLALLVLTAARASLGFQFQSLASVSPLLVEKLGVSYADAGFLIGLYMLPGVVLAFPGAGLGRRFGDKRVVLIGLALMTVGSLMEALAPSYGLLLVGRLISGIGGVLLNVLMSKMITDWFAGHEIVLAMAVFVNSFPIGIGVALLCLGSLAEHFSWPSAFYAGGTAAFVSLLLVALAYRRHRNDRQSAATSAGRISGREVWLTGVAGTIWGVFNGAFTIATSFAPILIIGADYALNAAGQLVGIMTWLAVISVQVGGLIAQRWERPNALMLVGLVGSGMAMLLLPFMAPALPLIVAGLLLGLPVGVIMALPAQVLQPESRATGMGLFYTGLYVGHAGLPPIAGALQDFFRTPAAPIVFVAVLLLSILPLYGMFRALRRSAMPLGLRQT